MTASNQLSYNSLNDFLNELSEQLRLHGSASQPVEQLMGLVTDKPEWKVPAEAAVRLRRAYEQDQPIAPLSGPLSVAPPASGGRAALFFACLAALCGLVFLVLLLSGQLPPFAANKGETSTDLSTAVNQLQEARGALDTANRDMTVLKKNAQDTLTAAQRSVSQVNQLFLRGLPVSPIDVKDVRSGMSFYTGPGLGPDKGEGMMASVIGTGPMGGSIDIVRIMGQKKDRTWKPLDTKRRLSAEELKTLAISLQRLEALTKAKEPPTVEEALLALKAVSQETLEQLSQAEFKYGDGK